jgi:hypothetical protein
MATWQLLAIAPNAVKIIRKNSVSALLPISSLTIFAFAVRYKRKQLLFLVTNVTTFLGHMSPAIEKNGILVKFQSYPIVITRKSSVGVLYVATHLGLSGRMFLITNGEGEKK